MAAAVRKTITGIKNFLIYITSRFSTQRSQRTQREDDGILVITRRLKADVVIPMPEIVSPYKRSPRSLRSLAMTTVYLDVHLRILCALCVLCGEIYHFPMERISLAILRDMVSSLSAVPVSL